MNSSSSGKKLEGFFNGKGFYIVLFLCAAVIGVSAWVMAAGNETMADEKNIGSVRMENRRVETIIVPSAQTEPVLQEQPEETAPIVSDEGLNQTQDSAATEEDASKVWREGDTVEVAAPLYAWPVTGEGIDILAPVGTAVTAAHSGSVESVTNDELMGTTVTVSHGDGGRTVYANLDPTVSVSVGDWVEPGTPIGAVGSTAICEVSQEEHLHFAITVNGEGVNPLNYLPA